MNIEQEIISAFPKAEDDPKIPDDFIEGNENIMEIAGEIDHFKYIPAYMLWCIRNKDSKLIDMYTINALAEYGRTKMRENIFLNFMYRCNSKQKLTILKFLEWCKIAISTSDSKQIDRAMKNWAK